MTWTAPRLVKTSVFELHAQKPYLYRQLFEMEQSHERRKWRGRRVAQSPKRQGIAAKESLSA